MDECSAILAAALAAHPDDAGLHCLMAGCFLDAGDAEQALDHYNLALHFRADCFPACSGRLQALKVLGRGAEALAVLESFLAKNPGHRDAVLAAAQLQYAQGAYQAVLDSLEPLLRIDPADRDAANLLGLVLGREFGEFDRAEALLRGALRTDPDWLPALVNLGWTLLEQCKYAEGYALIDRALEVAPGDADARLVRACMKLKQGEYAEGWRDYPSRHLSRFAAKAPGQFPDWRGESLEGRTLLIRGEQGIGDQIMFASCFAEVIARAGRTVIECNPKLEGLFRRSFPRASVHSTAAAGADPGSLASVGAVDFQIAMGDLPGMFRNRIEDFPSHRGYLAADPEKVLRWKARLADLGPGYKLGLSWRGGVAATRRHLRSLEPEQLLGVLRLPLHAVSLQYDRVEPELARLRMQHGVALAHWQDAIDDYDETAALVCALDGVLSVCTAVVHLAGALGRPVWVLAPSVTEWRYLDKGSTMPWYPSVHIIRQGRPGDWNAPMDAAIGLIAHRIASHGA